jgi:hypothetical protein
MMSDDLQFSNSLADLAERIKVEHAAVIAAVKQSLAHAMATGDLLAEAKAQLKHGQWRQWLAERCGIPERTASHYMRLARNRPEIEEKSATVADLTVRGAVALLAPEPEEPAEEAVPDVLWPGEIWLDIADITVRPKLYPRTEILTDVIERYMNFVEDVPAIEVNQRNELIDGFLRLKAAERIGRKRIRAFVTHVEHDMTHFSLAAYRNSTGGLQLPLHGHDRTLRDGTRVRIPGAIELRDAARKKLAMQAANRPTDKRQPWHPKPNPAPDWIAGRDQQWLERGIGKRVGDEA